jgi:hypothetical protein
MQSLVAAAQAQSGEVSAAKAATTVARPPAPARPAQTNPTWASATQRFALKAEKKHTAIHCPPRRGPSFGGGADIAVCNDCGANADSYTIFGYGYTNDTGISGQTFFTGSTNFKVKEVEVFVITN